MPCGLPNGLNQNANNGLMRQFADGSARVLELQKREADVFSAPVVNGMPGSVELTVVRRFQIDGRDDEKEVISVQWNYFSFAAE